MEIILLVIPLKYKVNLIKIQNQIFLWKTKKILITSSLNKIIVQIHF